MVRRGGVEKMGEWVPDPGGVSQVASMLLDGSSISNAQQQMAYQTLDELRGHPEFDMYLAYVMNAGAPGIDDTQRPVIRQFAGLLLKDQLKHSSRVLTRVAKETVKRELLMAIGDNTPQIQQTAAIAIATLVRTASLAGEHARTGSEAPLSPSARKRVDGSNRGSARSGNRPPSPGAD